MLSAARLLHTLTKMNATTSTNTHHCQNDGPPSRSRRLQRSSSLPWLATGSFRTLCWALYEERPAKLLRSRLGVKSRSKHYRSVMSRGSPSLFDVCTDCQIVLEVTYSPPSLFSLSYNTQLDSLGSRTEVSDMSETSRTQINVRRSDSVKHPAWTVGMRTLQAGQQRLKFELSSAATKLCCTPTRSTAHSVSL